MTTEPSPLVTICIPTYNGEKYLCECIESVLSQTYEHSEILIVDDCSSDDTLAIARTYASKNNLIRVIRNKHNLGLVNNWNHCITQSKGAWIKFVFQDDVIEPNCIQLMLEAIQDNCSLVVCSRDFIFENGVVENYQEFTTEVSMAGIFSKIGFIKSSEVIQAQLNFGLYKYKNFVGEPTSALIKRDAFQTYGLFNSRLIQLCDLELWLRLAVNDGLVYVPQTLAHFRVHNSSVSARNSNKEDLRVILDDLILLGEIMTNPFYKSLAASSSKKSVTDGLNEASKQYVWLKNWAHQSIDINTRTGAQFISNLEFLESNYPIICKHHNVLLKKAYAWVEEKLLWRFR